MSRANENGLVPVFLYQMVGRNFPRTVAGFMPDMAKELVAKGLATYDLTGATGAASVDAPVAKEPNVPKSAGPVDIPANWSDLHYLKQIKLAKQIMGHDQTQPMTKELAIQILTAEVARRANPEGVN